MRKQLFIFLMVAVLLCCVLVGCGDVELSSVIVKNQPTKAEYEIGETFEVAGTTLELTYSDGTTEEVAVTESMISSTVVFDSKGSKSIEITYTSGEIVKKANIIVTVKDSLGDAREAAIAVINGYEADHDYSEMMAPYVALVRQAAVQIVKTAATADDIAAAVTAAKADLDKLVVASDELKTEVNLDDLQTALDLVPDYVHSYAAFKVQQLNKKFNEKYADRTEWIFNYNEIYANKELLTGLILRSNDLEEVNKLAAEAEAVIANTEDVVDLVVERVLSMEYPIVLPVNPADDATWAWADAESYIMEMITLYEESLLEGLEEIDFSNPSETEKVIIANIEIAYNKFMNAFARYDCDRLTITISDAYQTFLFTPNTTVTIETEYTEFAGLPFDENAYNLSSEYRDLIDAMIPSDEAVLYTTNGALVTVKTVPASRYATVDGEKRILNMLEVIEAVFGRIEQLRSARNAADFSRVEYNVLPAGTDSLANNNNHEVIALFSISEIETKMYDALVAAYADPAAIDQAKYAEYQAFQALREAYHTQDWATLLNSDYGKEILTATYGAGYTLQPIYDLVTCSVEQIIAVALEDLKATAPRIAFDDAVDAWENWVADYEVDEINYPLVSNYKELIAAETLRQLIALVDAMPDPVKYNDAADAQAIADARAMYNTLMEMIGSVDEYPTIADDIATADEAITAKEARLAELESAANNANTAETGVNALIAAIPTTVKLGDIGAIEAAEAAFETWYATYHIDEITTDGDPDTTVDVNILRIVTEYQKLLDARTAYDSLVTSATNDVAAVIGLIDSLPNMQYLQHRQELEEAEAAFAAWKTTYAVAEDDETHLALVTNLDELYAARTAYDTTYANASAANTALAELIAAIPTRTVVVQSETYTNAITLHDKAAIEAAYAAYLEFVETYMIANTGEFDADTTYAEYLTWVGGYTVTGEAPAHIVIATIAKLTNQTADVGAYEYLRAVEELCEDFEEYVTAYLIKPYTSLMRPHIEELKDQFELLDLVNSQADTATFIQEAYDIFLEAEDAVLYKEVAEAIAAASDYVTVTLISKYSDLIGTHRQDIDGKALREFCLSVICAELEAKQAEYKAGQATIDAIEAIRDGAEARILEKVRYVIAVADGDTKPTLTIYAAGEYNIADLLDQNGDNLTIDDYKAVVIADGVDPESVTLIGFDDLLD